MGEVYGIRSRRVVLPSGVQPATVYVRDTRIDRVMAVEYETPGAPVRDVGNLVVMPGLVDTHVHVNEPGRTDWEGFDTATKAAAGGGITTLIDMPLNSIPATTTPATLEKKHAASRKKCWGHVRFSGGVVPGNTGES